VFEIENIVIVVKNGWWKGIRLEGVGVVNVEVFLPFSFQVKKRDRDLDK
jgi:hypothetical protein